MKHQQEQNSSLTRQLAIYKHYKTGLLDILIRTDYITKLHEERKKGSTIVDEAQFFTFLKDENDQSITQVIKDQDIVGSIVQNLTMNTTLKTVISAVRVALQNAGLMSIKEKFIPDIGEQVRVKRDLISTLKEQLNSNELADAVSRIQIVVNFTCIWLQLGFNLAKDAQMLQLKQ